MSTATAAPSAASALALRDLYVVRFVVQVAWAATVVLAVDELTTPVIVLFTLYPAFDLACAVVDRRRSGATDRPGAVLLLNMALSAGAALAIAVTAHTGEPAVLRVWGVWAITAGAVQLAVAVLRRGLGGQWPMILSGGISVVAGAGFLGQAGQADADSLAGIAGYATLGAIFFLASAIRLHLRAAKAA